MKRALSILFAIAAVLLASLSFACGEGEDTEKQNDPNLLLSFDRRDDLLAATYTDLNGRLECRTEGERTFARYEIHGNPAKGENCWPDLEFFSDSTPSLLPVRDFENSLGISVDIKNETARDILLNFTFYDKNYKRYRDYAVNLPANSDWKTLTFLFEFETYTDAGAAYEGFLHKEVLFAQFWFFNLNRGEEPIVLCFDEMRLEDSI